MIWAHISASLRETFPARASEWALGTILFLWSVVLNANPDLFLTTPTYRVLDGVIRQETWALLCLLAGGGRLCALAINGAWRRSPHFRALAAFVSALFWFEISVGAFQSGSFNTALAVYPVLFLLDCFNAIRAMGDAGRSDANHLQRVAGNGTDT